MLGKFFIYIKSWKYLNLKNKTINCIVVTQPGIYDDCLKHLKNYCWIEPLYKNIFHFSLIFPGLIHFCRALINDFKFTIQIWKFWPTFIFTLGLISKKKINTIISLTDYQTFPFYLKKIFKEKIKIIALQNSSRAYPLDRVGFIRKYDTYFLWNELNNNEKKRYNNISSTKPFGSLRMNLVINKNNFWEKIYRYPEKTRMKKICLISTYSSHHMSFFNKYLKGHNKDNFFLIIKKLEKKYKFQNKNNKLEKLKIEFMYLQILEFFYMIIFIKNFLDKHKFKLEIIERHKPSHPDFIKEKEFYKFFFEKDNVLSFNNHDQRLKYILKNKNLLFITNISSLGREILSVNQKAFFYSKWLYKFNPSYFQKSSIFFGINCDYEKFERSILKLLNISGKNYYKNLKKLKKTISAFVPKKENLKLFLNKSNISLNKVT